VDTNVTSIPSFAEYATTYANARMDRTPDGILRLALHRDGGPFVFAGQAHRELVQSFHDVASDRANQVVILTGAGERWLDRIDFTSLGPITTPRGWDLIYWEGKRLLQDLLSSGTAAPRRN
jgi:1,4-dihydroxy-2-naphthoyl-CoA synthase